MAASLASSYRPYRSRPAAEARVTTWVQIDLGESWPINMVRLYPFSKPYLPPGNGFPRRFRIECSEDPQFKSRQVIADRSKQDYPHPRDHIVEFRSRRVSGRYLRVTATLLEPEGVFTSLDHVAAAIRQSYLDLVADQYAFVLSKIEVLSRDIDVALHRPVSMDEAFGNPLDSQQLTRSPRPQGEGIISDRPENVTSPANWHAAVYSAQAPNDGVELRDGLFLNARHNNIQYLLESYSVDDLLRPFRERAGRSTVGSKPKPEPFAEFWEDDLAGSNAGRFLMGAGTTLHWLEHAELRARMNAVVDGIAECRQPNAYIMAYPEDTFFFSERAAYTRSWLTHGLIEAGYAGNARAFELLRGYYDWYNQCSYLPQALRGANQGGQGMVANTRMYFTPVGKPTDIHAIQRYFQENYWLEDLAARRPEAVWQYPYDRPHSYLLTNLEAYLDLYRATGEPRYLNAVLGAWELYRENWQNIGGSISIIESVDCPPKSNSLYAKLGETCGSAFWILLNHRLHLLYPEEEQYVAEIEKSIYNVLLANQDGSNGIRYHTMLVGQKERATCVNTCCEGQGTRLIGSLPQFIFSLTEDGIYVNLFEPSSVEWRGKAQTLRLEMETSFLKNLSVRLRVCMAGPTRAKIRIRIPSWTSGMTPIEINGIRSAAGVPGSYLTLDRVWSSGDVISFAATMVLKLTPYNGADRIAGRERYALEYGPLLMAAVGASEAQLEVLNATKPAELLQRLRPTPEQPLHFVAPLIAAEWMPYYEVGAQSFSCFPLIEAKAL
jgi:DUF1680 family protein